MLVKNKKSPKKQGYTVKNVNCPEVSKYISAVNFHFNVFIPAEEPRDAEEILQTWKSCKVFE